MANKSICFVGVLVVIAIFLTACGLTNESSIAESGKTAVLSEATTVQPTNTLTSTPSPVPTSTVTHTSSPTATSTPTDTPTPTPSPTPFGGGSGNLIFTVLPIRDGPLLEENGIYSVRSDGSEFKQLLSRSQLTELLGESYERYATYQRFGGQGYIVTENAIHLVSDDWQVTGSIDRTDLSFYLFSPDGNRALLSGPDNTLHIVPVDGSDPFVINMEPGGISDAKFSADGSFLYFNLSQGRSREQWIVDVDNEEAIKLGFEAFADYLPHEGKPIGQGYVSRSWPLRSIENYTVSPDREMTAFAWADLLFVADADDYEFLEPRLLARLPHRSNEELAATLSWEYSVRGIHWSPDSEHILVQISDSYQKPGDILGDDESLAIIRVEDGELLTTIELDPIFRDSDFVSINICGTSPDGNLLLVDKTLWDNRWENIVQEEFVLFSPNTQELTPVVDVTQLVQSGEQWTWCEYVLWP